METLAPPIASAGNRIVAFLIDLLIMVVIGATLKGFGLFISTAYLLTRDGLPFLDGQSIGKKVLGLQAVDYKGDPLTNTWKPVILRNVLLIIIPFMLIELVFLLNNDDGLRIGDHIANTRVVNIETGHTEV